MGTFKYYQQRTGVVRTIVAKCNIIWRENKMEKEDPFADHHNGLAGKAKEGQMIMKEI